VDRATGKHSNREQFQRLFEDAEKRRFDLVLFCSLDRFSREGVLDRARKQGHQEGPVAQPGRRHDP
jgi:DNA invertase Pin-like site-specific DNA recombinase